MFSDLVGSTALSARMDPEDLREVISAYQKCVAETVQRFGGYVAKYMGDGCSSTLAIRKPTRMTLSGNVSDIDLSSCRYVTAASVAPIHSVQERPTFRLE
jgi:class 3 adenylate cyclase